MNIYGTYIKPTLDISVSLILLLLLSWVLVPLALVLFISNNGQPFFIQSRPGKKGNIYKLIKFKTMIDTYNTKGELKTDDERLTKVGKFLRSTSVDELPQLINVLKGDMSFIGPRPLLVDYLPLYNEIQMRRHEVKPGITGWAQVNGRNSLSWHEKFKFDIWYVDNISFIVDFKIMLKTIIKVIKKEGINKEEMISMDRFMGNN